MLTTPGCYRRSLTVKSVADCSVPSSGVDGSPKFIATLLTHQWARAGAAVHIGVSTNRAGGRSGKVVVGDGLKVGALLGLEGCPRGAAVGRDDSVIVVRRSSPVDGLEAVFEFLGAAELPLAEDGPEHRNSSKRGDDDQEDSGNVAGGLCASG